MFITTQTARPACPPHWKM